MTSPDWKTRYAEIRPTYEVYEKKLRELVATVLEHAKIDVVQLEGRVKTLDSFAEKIGRKSGKYGDPLGEMTDLVGLRVIAYYLEDVTRIVEVLSTEFEVLGEHSANKQDELAPDQFGYTSNHLIVRIGPSRSGLPEWRTYAGITVEIQVRTTLQHAWAAVNHKLSYKRTEEVPASLQRRLFRLSALFEMADEQFSAIRQETRYLSDAYSDSVKQGNLAIGLDATSIDAYLLNSPKVRRIAVAAEKELGIRTDFSTKGDVTEFDRSDLIQTAYQLGARTIEQFDRLLPGSDKGIDQGLDWLRCLEADPAYTPRVRGEELSVYHLITVVAICLHEVPKSFYDSIYEAGWPQLQQLREQQRGRER